MNYSFLSQTQMFCGKSEGEIEKILTCLGASTAKFAKGETVLRCGQTTNRFGLVLSGGVTIENDDLWGNRAIISHAGKGEIFAEAYACTPEAPLLVSVVASEDTEVLFISTVCITSGGAQPCDHSRWLLSKLLTLSAQKSLQLSRRILYTSPKTIRGRLMTFFSDKAKLAQSATVTVPFNRQQLADFLGVDRSAMCNELSKMRRDGILRYKKNEFRLLIATDWLL